MINNYEDQITYWILKGICTIQGLEEDGSDFKNKKGVLSRSKFKYKA